MPRGSGEQVGDGDVATGDRNMVLAGRRRVLGTMHGLRTF